MTVPKVAAPPVTEPEPALKDVPVMAVALNVEEKVPVVALKAPPVMLPEPTLTESQVRAPPVMSVAEWVWDEAAAPTEL